MSTYAERRMARLEAKLRARTDHAGNARPGYKENVAAIRAEMEQLSIPNEVVENGE